MDKFLADFNLAVERHTAKPPNFLAIRYTHSSVLQEIFVQGVIATRLVWPYVLLASNHTSASHAHPLPPL